MRKLIFLTSIFLLISTFDFGQSTINTKVDKYELIIRKADKYYQGHEWYKAKKYYLKASKLKSDDTYSKDQVRLCDDNIKNEKLNKTYNDLITKADNKFKAKDWAGAKVLYQEASAMKADEQYPKDQIAQCDKLMSTK
ncbi:MAG TPA: hypothetical protein VL651_00395 [Bacteroidia bacterium]|jgi:hypothetical protein|nr:hypothetical protein [Bacteroidia bacterium]